MKFETAHIKKGDTVMVMKGKESGKSGRVIAVYPKKQRVLIEKVNFVRRHAKPSAQYKQGGIVEKESPVRWDNVMLVCAKCAKPVKISMETIAGGKKVRTCKKCKDQLDTTK